MPEITILKRPRDEAVITQRMFFKKTARGKVIKGTFHLITMHHLFKAVSQFYANGTFGTIYLVVLTAVGHVMRQRRLSFRVLGILLTKISPLGTISCPILMCFLHRYAYKYEVVHDAYPLQMDLIESNFFTPPIIILQTVMEEVRHRSLPLYSRLKALTTTDERKVWVFYNEFRS
jgi:exosome complex exonuclease DIS3/RRP44